MPNKKTTNAGKMIHYVESNNYQGTCSQCGREGFDKNIVVSNSPSVKQTKNQQISQAVNFQKGGITQFGNFYLGKPVIINYLGRMEGMSGGSGMPPLNKF
jgi:hypothetical protein